MKDDKLMGVSLDIYRLPLEEAIEAISYRTPNVGYIEEEMGNRSDGRAFPTLPSYPLPEHPPQAIGLARAFGYVHDAFAGTKYGRERDIEPFMLQETDDPLSWAVYGALLVGWDPPDFPLRYSLPQHVHRICEALDRFTEADMHENIARAVVGYDAESPSGWSSYQEENIVHRVLPCLRMFYRAARDEGEIVVHWMA